jgi:hypothetical protein
MTFIPVLQAQSLALLLMWVIKTEFGELVLTQRSEEMATVE